MRVYLNFSKWRVRRRLLALSRVSVRFFHWRVRNVLSVETRETALLGEGTRRVDRLHVANATSVVGAMVSRGRRRHFTEVFRHGIRQALLRSICSWLCAV
jgi:hypothetical protein